MKWNIQITITVLLSLSTVLVVNSIVVITSYGQENYTKTNFSRNLIFQTTVAKIDLKSQNDTTRPLVNITSPPYAPTVTTGKIIIQGTANDYDSGIHNVSALVHTFPFDGHFPIPVSQPIPISPNNWSHWSVPLIINTTGTYRVVIKAIDNAENRNYAQTIINAAIPLKNITGVQTIETQKVPKIAFVRHTFTEAAYQDRGFYDFYYKHGFPPFGKNITRDLDLLTVKAIASTPEKTRTSGLFKLSNLTALLTRDEELRSFWLPYIEHVKKAAPNATVTVMRDEDVDDGHIFYGDNKTNAYDVLLLSHNEYVTQEEYDNLRQFVKNGGAIVFIDPNILYAEVRYDKDNDTISLVKGHNWEFDGKTARRSVSERWYNETKDWVGGNFLANDITQNLTFTNNPFNYTHFEEQFVNNPNAKIIIDYGVRFPKDYEEVQSKKNELPLDKHLQDISIATYILRYGNGKVIMLGLYGQNLAKNQEFMRFFDNAIIPNSLCPKFQSCYLH